MASQNEGKENIVRLTEFLQYASLPLCTNTFFTQCTHIILDYLHLFFSLLSSSAAPSLHLIFHHSHSTSLTPSIRCPSLHLGSSFSFIPLHSTLITLFHVDMNSPSRSSLSRFITPSYLCLPPEYPKSSIIPLLPPFFFSLTPCLPLRWPNCSI